MTQDGAQTIRIGMAQMLVEAGKPDANLARAADFIAQAAGKGCQFVVLPECMDLGWADESANEQAQPLPGPRSLFLGEQARKCGLYVVAGLTERSPQGLHNSAVMLSPCGELLHVHRKIHTLVEVEGVYTTGDRLGAAPTEHGRIGINICADSCCPPIMHGLGQMGACLILSPCAWAAPAGEERPYGKTWTDAYLPIAREYDIGVVGVSNVGYVGGGPWKGWRCIGNSLAAAPGGEVLAWGPYGCDAEALLVVDMPVKPRPARGNQWRPHLKSQGVQGMA